MRKSFNLYFDSLDVLEELTSDQIAELFKAIVAYEKDGTEILTGLMKAVFTPFKNNSDRAKCEYERICERNKANGIKGGRKKPKEPSGLKSKPVAPDKDKDKDKDKLSNNISMKIEDAGGNINEDALNEWLSYKKYKSIAPITKTINFLCKYDLNIQQQIVDNSIMNGYKGLFEPKQNQSKQKQQFKSFEQQKNEEVSGMVDAVIDNDFNPFDPANYNQEEDVIDVQLTQRAN